MFVASGVISEGLALRATERDETSAASENDNVTAVARGASADD